MTELVEKLKNGEVTVTFKKKDDSIRVMKCTLKQSMIPEDKQVVSQSDSIIGDIIRVFDLEKQNWRSIDTTRIISQ